MMRWQELVRASWLAGVPLYAVLMQAPTREALRWAEREYRTLELALLGQRLSNQLNGGEK